MTENIENGSGSVANHEGNGSRSVHPDHPFPIGMNSSPIISPRSKSGGSGPGRGMLQAGGLQPA